MALFKGHSFMISIYEGKNLMGSQANDKAPLKVVKLDSALKIAEAWVNKMSGSSMEEAVDKEFEGRPPRLGLGAKVNKHAEVDDLTDPVERKILTKLGVAKKNPSSRGQGNLNKSKADTARDESDDESESRASAFAKKREAALPTTTPAKRKKK